MPILWFVTADGSAKVRDLETDRHINLAYYKDRTREWISVSGLATISRDRKKIREAYAPDWKLWFGSEGDPRHGTPDDPRIVLIGVDIHEAAFLEVNKPRPSRALRAGEGAGSPGMRLNWARCIRSRNRIARSARQLT